MAAQSSDTEVALRPRRMRAPQVDVARALRLKQGPLQEAMARMGYDQLREPQVVPIDNILAGRDVLVVLPTSGGKSALYVLPTLAAGWQTLVFSPLMALMRDQVMNLRAQGIPADYINSSRSDEEIMATLSDWVQGHISLLFVAPERLNRNDFLQAMRQRPPDFTAVDECHCVSQWADIFRPSYCYIGDFIEEFNPKVVAALTATCNEGIEQDIYHVLGLPHMSTIWRYYPRNNLHLSSAELNGLHDIAEKIREIEGRIIVYFSTVKRLEKLAPELADLIQEDIGLYHGQLRRSFKDQMQDMFKAGSLKVIAATNAFGMGVDIPDIRAVIHHDPPGTPEALSQEVGRAGRDGLDSYCTTFHNATGWQTQRNFIEMAYPPAAHVKAVYRALTRIGGHGQVIRMTAKEMAQAADIPDFGSQSILNLLKGKKVLQDIDAPDRTVTVHFTGSLQDDRFEMYRGAVTSYGTQENGAWKVSLDYLKHVSGTSEETVMKWLSEYHKQGVIHMVPPNKAQPRVLVNDISVIDFEHLEQKERMLWWKLEKVKEYVSIPDSHKHDFLREYFEMKRE